MLGFDALSAAALSSDAGSTAQGFAAARFGIPSLPLPVAGFAPLRMGVPAVQMLVTPLQPVQFGTPRVVMVSGFAPVGFGLPAIWRVEGFSATQFGTPSLPTAQGFRPIAFGTPDATPLRLSFGFHVVRFGAATHPSNRTFEVQGWRALRVSPRMVAIRYVAGRPRFSVRPPLRPVRFGRPTYRSTP